MAERAQEYQRRQEQVGEFQIGIESYRLGDTYYCRVDNVSPGALLARGQGSTREEAEADAVKEAKEKIAQTKTHPS